MRVLVAEDEKAPRMRLEKGLSQWGLEVEAFADRNAVWKRLCEEDPLRQGVDNLIEGVFSGADDYVTKPFVGRELRSQIDVGVRGVGLERMLDQRKTGEKS